MTPAREVPREEYIRTLGQGPVIPLVPSCHLITVSGVRLCRRNWFVLASPWKAAVYMSSTLKEPSYPFNRL